MLVTVLALAAAVPAAQAAYAPAGGWGTLGSGPGQFNQPKGLAVDGAGVVYVADSLNNRIVKFDSSGNFLTQWGSLGTGDGQMRLPADVAAPSAGAVYVVDDTNRVQMFNPNGTFVLSWGSLGTGDGQFE